MERTEIFEAERPRLVGIASRVLADHAEAEDVVQQAWLRLERAVTRDRTEIENLPAWLTTVTTRLCLDRLRARTPMPLADADLDAELAGTHTTAADPADDVALADTVGIALQAVIDRLSPRERVAFVLHDSFGFEFATIAAVLDTSPAAARKLASRARSKVAQPAAEDALADWEVVDAFMAAARGGDLERLLQLLAPDAHIGADEVAALAGTPTAIEGRDSVATFFNGSAHAALPIYVGDRPAFAWYHRGEARVVFDFTIAEGHVQSIICRAEPAVLAQVVRRRGADAR
ncbi:sigma-70 family RNA polymerase sigma factor [Nocardioides hwasunensis]|uniref:Sigma-70 family RNA polymerase sigma factor n=1 Tax=Nocardioides hwasunensis TaxID=397258 RepID=A0ABR8MN54_9ACTN|nr:sigma-70 family RNA polymerase sigma factor [Nocardioides hwasunensis]MBD3916245.1 sigma-70 family RNA polymerase sigma factor [Nocardioides hwasunensis]